MVGFEVSVNRRSLCTAGIGDVGVLTVIVSAVVRKSEAGPEAPELTLEVGGFTGSEHTRWPGSNVLAVGDEVVIRLVETAAPDAAIDTTRHDPAVGEAQERAYFERLKTKYEA